MCLWNFSVGEGDWVGWAEWSKQAGVAAALSFGVKMHFVIFLIDVYGSGR